MTKEEAWQEYRERFLTGVSRRVEDAFKAGWDARKRETYKLGYREEDR